jgi:hypothetical protein
VATRISTVSENYAVQNTNEILSHEMYAAKMRQASQKNREKERMHLKFLAAQIDASRGKRKLHK